MDELVRERTTCEDFMHKDWKTGESYVVSNGKKLVCERCGKNVELALPCAEVIVRESRNRELRGFDIATASCPHTDLTEEDLGNGRTKVTCNNDHCKFETILSDRNFYSAFVSIIPYLVKRFSIISTQCLGEIMPAYWTIGEIISNSNLQIEIDDIKGRYIFDIGPKLFVNKEASVDMNIYELYDILSNKSNTVTIYH